MALLAAAMHDPATVVTKSTTAALAMTALDTTNLRLTVTVPANGAILVQLAGVLHGATTFPQVLLGVMSGATVVGRVAPRAIMAGTALATTMVKCHTEFVVPNLTPGASVTWDAAYGVETSVAASALKYGGPNDTTSNNAFGAFTFSLYSI